MHPHIPDSLVQAGGETSMPRPSLDHCAEGWWAPAHLCHASTAGRGLKSSFGAAMLLGSSIPGQHRQGGKRQLNF